MEEVVMKTSGRRRERADAGAETRDAARVVALDAARSSCRDTMNWRNVRWGNTLTSCSWR